MHFSSAPALCFPTHNSLHFGKCSFGSPSDISWQPDSETWRYSNGINMRFLPSLASGGFWHELRSKMTFFHGNTHSEELGWTQFTCKLHMPCSRGVIRDIRWIFEALGLAFTPWLFQWLARSFNKAFSISWNCNFKTLQHEENAWGHLRGQSFPYWADHRNFTMAFKPTNLKGQLDA